MASGIISKPYSGLFVKQLGSSDDLNTLYGKDASGFYEIGMNVANSPANWCWLIVTGGTGTHQYILGSYEMQWRAYTGTPLHWTSWQKISTARSYGVLGSNLSGQIRYCYSGPMVTISGIITTQAAIAKSDTIGTGLPKSMINNVPFRVNNNNTVNSYYTLFITDSGTITASEAIPSGASLRFAASYMQSE